MKKQLLLFILMLLPMIASADEIEINGIYYQISSKTNEAIVTNGRNCSGDISIPESIQYNGVTYSVTSIGEKAFSQAFSLTSIKIPSSVKSIEAEAFHLCRYMKSVDIPNSVTSIGGSAFERCYELTNVTIPNSVTIIGVGVFAYCYGLTSIEIPSSVKTLDSSAFIGCNNLSSVIIQDGVENIGGMAFMDCKSLSSLSIPNSVSRISGGLCQGCSNLTSVVIGNNVGMILSNAFKNCPELKDFYCYTERVPVTASDAFSGSMIEYSTLHVPTSSINSYKAAEPWKNFKEIVKISMPEHTLTYKVDGQVYKTYTIEEGETITPEPEPTQEGYTFSGWSEIPETMPDHDVTVTGSFTINKYKLTYTVDGSVYKTYDVEYGASITPEAEPSKEGYTFSGWSDIPSTMPAQDVTVTGTFTVNKYKLTYLVDNEVYSSYDVEYGATITPEAPPTKENYIFSGWSDIPRTMPAHDVTVTGSFTYAPPKAYTLTYMVDGEVYKTVSYYEGDAITPEAEPAKEGYTFSGWSYIPSTMPAEDVTVTGTFTVNKYTLTYKVDGVVYKSYEIAYGSTITPEAEPKKEGYTFSGWSDIPQTMPAHDVTVTGTFTKGAYKLIYMVDGEVYKTVSYDYGETITPEAEPTKEGYTFSGWSNIPTTMPANDVTVTGTFTVNKYKLTYMVDGEVYKSYDVEYGAAITPEAEPTKAGYKFSGWSYIPSKMPAEDVTVVGTFTQEAEVKNNVSYEIVGSNASVTHADNAKGEIKIEESVEINGKTYQVTSIADGAFQGCTGLTSIELPNTITTIGKNAFDGCSGLIIIKIGKGIKEIGSKAFANIGNSKARTRAEDTALKVYCEAEVLPSTAADAFENTPIDKATLYVADGLVDVYKLVMPWNGFGTIVGLSTGINSVIIDSEDAMIFDMQGNRLDNVRKGVNIIRMRDGKTKKMVVK